jgi:glycosyltransferase involved in cell wall biosynthesis
MKDQISMILPVHNEAYHLKENAELLNKYLNSLLTRYELLLVENGSKDETVVVAKGLINQYKNMRLIQLTEPSLGLALKTGAMEAKFNRIIYFPIDLSVELSFIPQSIELLEDYDIVIGSKRMRHNLDHREWHRILLSRGYHRLVRLLYDTSLTDTTCVKAYRRDEILEMMNRVPSGSQVFETEVLMEAQKYGLKVIEVPVIVNDYRKSRQSLYVKVNSKMRDLLSIRLDQLAFKIGGLSSLLGFSILIWLSWEKLSSGHTGFLNPYSFLLSIALVAFGFQIIIFGFMANLFLQLRKSIEFTLSKLLVEAHHRIEESKDN